MSKMKQNKISGSVVLLNSIYGFLAQNLSVYKNTKNAREHELPL